MTNLLSNGDFEQDSTGWPFSTGFTISSDAYQGLKSARLQGNSSTIRGITLTPGKTYKVSYWAKLNPSTCTGDCWGWVNVALDNFQNITYQINPPMITPNNTTLGIWNKYSFQFTLNGTVGNGQIKLGSFSSPNWNWDFQVDDIKVFEPPTSPVPPTVTIASDKTTVSTISDSVNFTSKADDDDGSVNYFFWDFGDGGKSNLPNPSYKYSSNGTYIAKLIVYDDSGLSASSQMTITVNDPALPTLTIANPATSSVDTTSNQYTISGTASAGAGKTISKVEYSTDRGMVGAATGSAIWSANLNFGSQSGPHKVLISVTNNTGDVVSNTVIISYKPGTKIDLSGGASGVTQNSSTVELYDKFESTFNIVNAQFSNPYFPYDPNLPDGMPKGTGVSIDATFISPSGKIFKQPAFLYQNYQRVVSTKQLIAQGDPVWKIRFAPTEIGKWTYSISLTDSSGNTIVSDPTKLTFNAVVQTNPFNHGFLQPSQKDKRYFEYSDGTPFIGVGPGPYLNDSFSIDDEIAKVTTASGNFSRTWMSGANISGSSWAPWAGGMGNVSNSPGTSLTTEQAYGDSVYSLTLPAQGPGSDSANPSKCLFYGFYGTNPSVKTNTNYRILVRLKTVGVTGSGGFTLRPVGQNWPGGGNCDVFAAQPLTLPYQKGTTDWHTVSSNWNSGSLTKLGFMLATLENVTAGRIFIDEISIREDLGNGQLGPEVLSRSKFNVQNYFSQEPSFNWDYGLDKFAEKGIFEKAVIEEKDDYSYGYISPYGYGYDKGGQIGFAASIKYQSYFWRYLIARYGYSRAVHSWEYANEQAPGSLAQAEELAKYMINNDPNKHMATSSNWAGLDGGWTNPAFADVSNADAHSYVTAGTDNTTWLPNGIDPLTNVFTGDDTAVFSAGHSLDAYSKNLSGGRPWIMGEAGIGKNGVTAGNNDTQTKGDWFHQFIWAQVNSGGMYFVYWYDQTIRSNNLSPIMAIYRQFMEGKTSDTVNTRVPLNNGNYTDIQLTLPSGLRGWGQKDITNGGAHFWFYDSAYTWINTAGGTNVGGKTVSFNGLPAKTYTVEFWDTWTGSVTKQSISHGGGVMTLTIPTAINQKDVAVKIYPTSGYTSTQIIPTPAPTSTASTAPNKPGDLDGNNKVDIFDYNILLTNFGKTGSGIQGDIDNSGKVDIFDYNLLLTNFGT